MTAPVHPKEMRVVPAVGTAPEVGAAPPRRPLTGKLALFLGLLSLCLLTYTSMFMPVRVSVFSSSPTLLALPGATVAVSIRAENRLGWKVPFSSPRLRCEFLDGGGLVSLRYAADSTSVMLESLGSTGAVELRIFTPASAFPLSLRVPILPPFA